MAKLNTLNRHARRKQKALNCASSYELAKSVLADFPPELEAVRNTALATIKPGEAVARKFLEEVFANEVDAICHVPLFAVKPHRFAFIDMVNPPSDFAETFLAEGVRTRYIFPIAPLRGITFGAIADLFRFDPEGMLMSLTCLAAILIRTVECDDEEEKAQMEKFTLYFVQQVFNRFNGALDAHGAADPARTH
ncbi:hypothetical protein HB770_04140 [Rhizobium leguminosarum bv. viciae]|uniref:Uncharacterized protein n=1 Tax=Rhizobium leguminosarum bv. viciae TaxID=387 RepID=A0A7G6RHV4_RHILV|nr:hypothetical protein HB770_04140 [Rhizobium leguminosarum bv. viciae]